MIPVPPKSVRAAPDCTSGRALATREAKNNLARQQNPQSQHTATKVVDRGSHRYRIAVESVLITAGHLYRIATKVVDRDPLSVPN